jgi:hypothetical protein
MNSRPTSVPTPKTQPRASRAITTIATMMTDMPVTASCPGMIQK